MKQLVDRFPQGVVQIPPSKSEAHRVLICAALAKTKETKGDGSSVFVPELGLSEDVRATAVGIQTIVTNGEKGGTVDCGESGSTLRFLIPVAAMTGGEWTFTGRGRLLDRPMGIFADLFRSHGAHYEQTPEGITVRGPLPAGVYELPGDVSSQFVSGLLLALPLADAPLSSPRSRESHSEIILTSPLESAGYVDLTIETMRSYGIIVRDSRLRGNDSSGDSRLRGNDKGANGNDSSGDSRLRGNDKGANCTDGTDGVVTGWRVPAGQRYFSPGAGEEHVCGGDWSQAAFFLCAGALGCDVSVAGLERESVQGDRRVADILESMGAHVAWRAGLVRAYPPAEGRLHGVVIDARDIPDIVPPLAALACYASGETQFRNAGRLRIKESDRLAALSEELAKLGADIRETPDGLVIQGNGGAKLRGGAVQAHGDHRIAMALAVAAIGCETPVVIDGAESVAKSYPAFWDDFLKHGME
ncbi:MAG: 3-phosphoshikimate 1-carboxyvinyltransferase [Clostridiales Family XIII bacterium]|jgi:3-phosphoshikimate 1-carboxyvinyltransferase|nr:3-phosphoshikimate 1-carboxyvinyltransferase [Clostridiales Family XIII bacterium]